MTPEQEKKLAKIYRDLAEDESADNAVDETCEVRFVSAKRPLGAFELSGAWVDLWRWIPSPGTMKEEELLGKDPAIGDAEPVQPAPPATPAPMAPDEWLSPEELAARWKVSKQTVRRLRKSGKLPVMGVTGALYRIRMVDILQIESEGKLLPSIAPRYRPRKKTP
jgi:excisionase family DNA binding protein